MAMNEEPYRRERTPEQQARLDAVMATRLEKQRKAELKAQGEPLMDGTSIPLKKKLRVQFLFVHEGHAKTQIAKDVRLTLNQVNGLIDRNPAWEMEKLEREERMRNALVSVDREKAAAEGTAEIIAEIGSKAAELTIGAMDLAMTKIDDGDAQGLNYAASAAKTFNGLFRQARGLDAEGNGNIESNVPLVLLVGNYPLIKPMKTVEPTEAPVETVDAAEGF